MNTKLSKYCGGEKRNRVLAMENGDDLQKKLGIVFLGAALIVGIYGFFLVLNTSSTRLYFWVLVLGCAVGALVITGAILLTVNTAKNSKSDGLIGSGKYVYADIVEVGVNMRQRLKIDQVFIHPYFIICQYTGQNGKTYRFKSRPLLYNPSGLISENRLRVYVNLERPDSYYVDTSSILPDSAVLHKFKIDSPTGAERMIRGGQHIEAVTCGVETTGIGDKKSSVFARYTVLCRYDAPDGRVHIFASAIQWGEPDRAYCGERVRVYYSGMSMENYHVALDTIQM